MQSWVHLASRLCRERRRKSLRFRSHLVYATTNPLKSKP